jgi:predicted phage terminase large subunit-like protein
VKQAPPPVDPTRKIITIKPGQTSPEVEQIKKYCRESLFFVCKEFLGYKDWDEVHDDVEALLRRPARKKCLLLPRNHLKSSIVTIGFVIQNIIKDPNIRILIGNGVWDMSRKFLDEIKAQLEMSQLKYLFGDFVSARWNADEIICKQRTKPVREPTVMTTGVEAEQTGGHYDLIILDDLTGLQNSQTPEQREKTKRFRRSMINLLDPKKGMLIEIGTRWHLDDTFSVIFEKERKYYDIMIRKVVENGKLIFPKKFAKKFDPVKKDWLDVDDPTCMDYIDHLKASMPLDEFSAQYLNQPFSSENQLFKNEYFKYWRERPKGLYIAMTIDLASSAEMYADETAIVVCGMDHEYKIYVLDYVKGRWGTASEVVERIFQTQEKWHPNVIGMETMGYQRIYKLSCEAEMRKRRNYFSIDEVRTGPQKSKFERIKLLEPFYRDGKVYHALWMQRKDLENQLQVISQDGLKGKRDDLADAMSMALPFLRPGSTAMNTQEDDWDKWMRMANENSQPNRGFFQYGA